MTDPQIWILIGVFAAAMFGTLGLIIPLVNSNTRASVDGLREAMVAGFTAVDAKVVALGAELRSEITASEARTNERITASEARTNERITASEGRLQAVIEALDRDVQAITKRVLGDDAR